MGIGKHWAAYWGVRRPMGTDAARKDIEARLLSIECTSLGSRETAEAVFFFVFFGNLTAVLGLHSCAGFSPLWRVGTTF